MMKQSLFLNYFLHLMLNEIVLDKQVAENDVSINQILVLQYVANNWLE